MKIGLKLTTLLISISIVPIILIGGFFLNNTKNIIVNDVLTNLDVLASIQKERINEIVEKGSSVIDDEIISIVSGYTGGTDTGEMVLARRNVNGDAEFMHRSRFETESGGGLEAVSKEDLDIPITQALLRNEDVFEDVLDYRGEPILAVTRYIEDLDYGFVLKVDQSEAFSSINTIRNMVFKVVGVVLFLVAIIGFFVSRSITHPLNSSLFILDGAPPNIIVIFYSTKD